MSSVPWPTGPVRVPEISVQQLQEMQQAGKPLLLVDVRQPWEAQQANLPGSVLEPLNTLAESVEELREQARGVSAVIVYCHHGMRSQLGADILQRAGIAGVVSLRGGIDAWSVHIDPSVPRY